MFDDVDVLRDIRISSDEKNANKGTKRGRKMLASSLEEFGAGRSIVIDKNGKIIGGNKTYEKAMELGMNVEIVHTDPNTLVAVMRDDLDLEKDPRARGLAYADNRVAEVNLDWEIGQISDDFESGLEMDMFFTDQEISRIMAKIEKEETLEEPEMEFSEEVKEEHNYIVLYFDNEIDWLNALSVFDLQHVRALQATKTYDVWGTGRVIKGAVALQKIRENLK